MLDLFGITEENRIVYNSHLEVVRSEYRVVPTMARTNGRTMASQIWSRPQLQPSAMT